MAEKSKSTAKTVSLIIILTLIGKLLGLFRNRMLTVTYGGGMAANAVMAASVIPRTFFDAMFATAISASFIPIFNEYYTKKGKKEAIDFSGNFITVMAFLSLILTLLGIIFAGPLVDLGAGGFDPATKALCVSLTRIMMPTVFVTFIAYSFVGILQSFDEFNIPALISVIANGIVIIYYFTLNKKFGVYGLAVAFLIAWSSQALVQVPALVKKGFRFRPSLNFRSDGMKKTFALMLPVLVSTWIQPINQMVNTNFGSRIYNGFGVMAINLASDLYLIITGAFVFSVTNVLFPHLSRLSAEDDTASMSEMVRTTLHATLYFVFPMMLGLMAVAGPIINLVYGGGKYGADEVAITSRALFFISLGMVGYSVQTVLCRVYFAEQNGKMPLISAAVSIGVNIALSALLVNSLNVTGLALASAAAFTVSAVILIIPLEKRGFGILTASFLKDMAKAFAASAVMAVAAWELVRLMGGTAHKFLLVLIPAAAGAVIYFALTWLMGLSEARTVMSAVGNRLKNR